jgi:hypothetical protein
MDLKIMISFVIVLLKSLSGIDAAYALSHQIGEELTRLTGTLSKPPPNGRPVRRPEAKEILDAAYDRIWIRRDVEGFDYTMRVYDWIDDLNSSLAWGYSPGWIYGEEKRLLARKTQKSPT